MHRIDIAPKVGHVGDGHGRGAAIKAARMKYP